MKGIVVFLRRELDFFKVAQDVSFSMLYYSRCVVGKIAMHPQMFLTLIIR